MNSTQLLDNRYKKRDGDTALHIAAGRGRNDEVRALLDNNVVAIDSKNDDGETALHVAAHYGHAVVLQMLINNKAAVDEKNNNGNTPLHIAAENGRNEVVQTLLNYKAAVDEKNDNGNTALHVAAENGHNEVVQTLLKNNACVDETDNYRGTPLHECCRYEHCVLTLLAAGAGVHTKRTYDGATALHRAAVIEATTIVPLLVAMGADLDAVDRYGRSPRQYLADRGLQVDLSEVALERARRDIAKTRLDFVRHRALQVCIGLQPRGLDALQLCEILQFASGSLASLIEFHQWWKIATTVKHFHKED